MSRRALLAGVALLAGCAEMRRPPPPAPPADLVGQPTDPIRGTVAELVPAFADSARALAGRPAAAARAAAQLEFVTQALTSDQRYAGVPDSVRRDLVLARIELRDALGVAETLPADRASAALLDAARALAAGDAARAAAALPAPSFRPGGARSVARLGDLGPLPQGAIATSNAAQAIARLDSEGRWLAARPLDAQGSDVTVSGFAGATSVGY